MSVVVPQAVRAARILRDRVPDVLLPTTDQLLTAGGDARICDSGDGLNKYGCPSIPDQKILAYGSSTASIISERAFEAAERLRLRLIRSAQTEAPNITYTRELDLMRTELLALCKLSDIPGVDVVFAASGTDIHLIAARLASQGHERPILAVMIEPAETGSGIPSALAGRHFSDFAALGESVVANTTVSGAETAEIASITARLADGSPRSIADIDAEVESHVVRAVRAGQRVLLNLVDVSKTGIIAPSPSCALELRRRFPESVDVFIDGCQFRLSLSTLRSYLHHGFWIALTGSKFVSGPAFSGALLFPPGAARRLRHVALPPGLRAYSARGEWPKGWLGRHAFPDIENYGLLLRWEAALAELRAFHSLPEVAITDFLKCFAQAVQGRLAVDPMLKPVSVPTIGRQPLTASSAWDSIPTIFPFALFHPPGSSARGKPLDHHQTKWVYSQLGKDCGDSARRNSANTKAVFVWAVRCQLGQPVHCGAINGTSISALRLCVSARLIVDAVSPQGRGARAVIDEALTCLNKAAILSKAVGKQLSVRL
jgi:hypothetical protein